MAECNFSILLQTTQPAWTSKDYVNTSIMALSALGTVAAVFLAIFGEQVRRWFLKPKISVNAGNSDALIEDARTDDASIADENSIPPKAIKLRLINTGSATAQSCQVFIEKIFIRRTESSSYYLFKSISIAALNWPYELRQINLIPNIPSYVEMARVSPIQTTSKKDEQSEEQNGMELFLSIEEPGRRGTFIRLGKGTFVIPLKICGDNIKKPITKYVEIFWAGPSATVAKESDFYIKILAEKNVPDEAKER